MASRVLTGIVPAMFIVVLGWSGALASERLTPVPPWNQPITPVPMWNQQSIDYSSWGKVCGRRNGPKAGQECSTGRAAYRPTGELLAAALVIERDGWERRALRIFIPPGTKLAEGARVALDDNPPIVGTSVTCFSKGCLADFAVDADFVTALKRGRALVFHGVDVAGQAFSHRVPLDGFAQANEGPATHASASGGRRDPIICAGVAELCAHKRVPGGDPPAREWGR